MTTGKKIGGLGKMEVKTSLLNAVEELVNEAVNKETPFTTIFVGCPVRVDTYDLQNGSFILLHDLTTGKLIGKIRLVDGVIVGMEVWVI